MAKKIKTHHAGSRRGAPDKTAKKLQNVTHDEVKNALRLAARAWRCLPCAPCSKTPLVKWRKMASSDLAVIGQWKAKYPTCNWGVVCGPESGIWILDVDGDEGRRTLATLEAEHGELPSTLTSRTGRHDGGEHRWFRYPTDGEIISYSAHKLGAGLDVRASGGYVIIPKSIHPTGATYRWCGPLQLIADAPAWLLQILRDPARPRQVTSANRSGRIPVGRRNDTLTRRAGALRRKGATKAELEAALFEINQLECNAPLNDADVRKIAASVARYEPVSGPDPLERAWQFAQAKPCPTNYHEFLEICRALQISRPDQPIVLPLVRISALLNLHWTTISGYRKKAVKDGILLPISERYVPHREAGSYWFRGIPRDYN
jgi:hypothetical protein